jgi:hypothetical protein
LLGEEIERNLSELPEFLIQAKNSRQPQPILETTEPDARNPRRCCVPASKSARANASTRPPFLADALEEASCTNADILGHCRQRGQHVRGCWVVDLILGKR